MAALQRIERLERELREIQQQAVHGTQLTQPQPGPGEVANMIGALNSQLEAQRRDAEVTSAKVVALEVDIHQLKLDFARLSSRLSTIGVKLRALKGEGEPSFDERLEARLDDLQSEALAAFDQKVRGIMAGKDRKP